MTYRVLMAALLMALLASACAEEEDEPGISRINTGPALGEFVIDTRGGASTEDGFSGGNGGSVTISINGGRLREPDDAPLPEQANNFLTNAELDGDVVTYTELVDRLAPVIAGGEALFQVGGTDLRLPAGFTLDLSDAPPAIISVAIELDGLARIDGLVRLRRETDPAVHFRLAATGALALTGAIDGAGSTALPGANVLLSGADCWLTGRIITRGGAADDSNDAGAGGLVQLSAQGDLRLRAGALLVSGGAGRLQGGDGGNVALTVSGASGGDFRWGIDTRGGAAHTGKAGDGGDILIALDGTVGWFNLMECGGGQSAEGSGGAGGDIALAATEARGLVQARAAGGHAPVGDGGRGGGLTLDAAVVETLTVSLAASGGVGDVGGDGGHCIVRCTATMRNATLDAALNGGNAVNQAGNGGIVSVIATGAALSLDNVALRVTAIGGNGGNSGVGGTVEVEGTTFGAAISAQDLYIRGDVRGGDGSLGGTGGTLRIEAPAGDLHGTLEGQADGGRSDAAIGVPGGQVVVVLDAGSIDMHVAVTAKGGNAPGANAGDGGALHVDSANSGSGGACLLGGFFSAGGGNGDIGGDGGSAFIGAGAGTLLLQGFNASVQGGAGDTAGAGGAITLLTGAGVMLNGGALNAPGGAGVTAGGAGGVITIRTAAVTVQSTAILNLEGGAGDNGGFGGALMIDTDDDATADAGSIVLDGSVQARGGAGTLVGGDGGIVHLFATADDAAGVAGSIHVRALIRADGGDGPAAGFGGVVLATTRGQTIALHGLVSVTGEDGGDIRIGDGVDLPVRVVVNSTARLIADGVNAGLAGFITLDPQGAAPNPNLIIETGAELSTRDGDGTDRTGTNQLLD